jgi:hypothetical protein
VVILEHYNIGIWSVLAYEKGQLDLLSLENISISLENGRLKLSLLLIFVRACEACMYLHQNFLGQTLQFICALAKLISRPSYLPISAEADFNKNLQSSQSLLTYSIKLTRLGW